MNDVKAGVLALIKSGLTGETVTLPSDFDWEEAVRIAVRHRVAVMLYYGIYNSGADVPAEIADMLKVYTFKRIQQEMRQEYETKKLFAQFDKNEIQYLPLKGAILKYLYPKPEMRYMGDVDLLIKPEQYNKIAEIVKNLGFEFVVESNHELVWDKKGALHLELHKLLIPSYNEDYFKYYKDGWRLAHQENGSWFMSDEDFLIYNFTHLAKHYRDSGIGIKHFTDIWVYRNAKPNLDEEYVRAELSKLKLLDFYENVIRLLNAWFDGGEFDEISEFMTEWIFDSGVYGNKRNKELSKNLKFEKKTESGRFIRLRLYIDQIFMPYNKMITLFPILKKMPFLLPVFWIVRIGRAVLFRRENIKTVNEGLRISTKENIDEHQTALNYVGLDFNFDEN